MLKKIIIVACCLVMSFAGAQDEKQFKAGVATTNITPWNGLSLAGHMADRVALRVHDELHVRALVLDNGEAQIAFAIIDSCMVPREIMDAAKIIAAEATGIATDHMLISATHTHTATCATPVFQSDPNVDYNRFLTQRVADAIALAHTYRVPAKIGWSSGDLADEVFNRRWHMTPETTLGNPFGTTDQVRMNPPRGSDTMVKPAGLTDPEISFIAIQDLAGKPLGLLANYSLHYVGGTNANEVSADYFGIFAKRIEALLMDSEGETPFVGMMTNGTSGDINNINFREIGKQRKPYEKMTEVARKAADVVVKAYQDVEYQSWIPMSAATKSIDLGVRKPSAAEVAEAKEVVAKAAGPAMKGMIEIYARETVQLNDYPDTVPVLLQVLKLGDLAIAAVPCEVFVEIGLDFKANSPFKDTFTIELANGYNGYLPTYEQHQLGGYETWRAKSSYLEEEADRKIRKTIFELMDTLKD